MFLTTVQEYEILRTIARITHANICIKGGNYLQYEIYRTIKETNKHLEVHHEYSIKLLDIQILIDGKKPRRKHHKVDILIVDETSVTAINSKGRSFDNTESEDSKLAEYLWYKKSIEAAFPDKQLQ